MLSVNVEGCFNSTLNNSQSQASAENNSTFKIQNSTFIKPLRAAISTG